MKANRNRETPIVRAYFQNSERQESRVTSEQIDATEGRQRCLHGPFIGESILDINP